MATVVGISGSLRAGSYNSALLRAAAELAPAGLRIEIATIRGIPLYDGDLEQEGIPREVTALKDRITAADGLLLASPEYNNSVPGVLKNAIDWLTRPPDDIGRVFRGRPVGVIGATPGQGGTRLAQSAWLPVLRALGVRPFFDRSVYLAGARGAFDREGRLSDDRLRELLAGYLAGFASFIQEVRA